MTHNQDFQLCADGGLQDRVREFTKGYKVETLQIISTAFTKYLSTGVMPFAPNIAGMFAEVYHPMQSHDDNMHNVEVARDTLVSIISESGV